MFWHYWQQDMNGSRNSRPDLSVTASAPIQPPRRLDSWKEIASYLGRSEKTVRRWEQTEGLPAHRLHHAKGSSVYAYSTEMDEWREARKEAKPGSSPSNVAEIRPPDQRIDTTSPDPPVRSIEPVARGRRWLLSATIALLFLIGSLVGMRTRRLRELVTHAGTPSPIQSLAVLPFGNLSKDPDQEYFADGMTEQLITELARASRIRVISPTSVMHYKNTTKSLPEIARELEVDAVIEGTVQRSANRVRMTAQLITPSPERLLWADVYEGDIRNILDLQRDVARDIQNKVQVRLAGRQASFTSTSSKPLDPRTYEDYLRGRHFLARRDAESMNKALRYFEEAARRDPGYAPAYAGLAMDYVLLGSYEVLPPRESFAKVRAYADQAIRLDDTLSEAYTARAVAASFRDLNWSAADRDFERAIALNPGFALAHHMYGEHLTNVGMPDRAIAELRRARELDPLSLATNGALGRVYRDAHRYQAAREQCRNIVELDPHIAMGHWCMGQLNIGERRYPAAVIELELARSLGTTPLIIRDLGWAYAALGNKEKAREILGLLKRPAQPGYSSPYSIAVIHAALGEKDAAFQWLERAYVERDSQFSGLVLDADLDPLRSDPRFTTLLKRLHLPR